MSRVVKPVIVVIAAVLALTGCAPADNPPTPPATASTDAATPTPTSTPLTEIPMAAFLQPEDLGPGDVLTEAVPLGGATLNICGNALLDSGAFLAARKHIGFRYYYSGNQNESDGYGYEVITSYRSGGAEAYLAEVRERVAGPCARNETEESIWESVVAAEGFGGDDSMRIRSRDYWKSTGRAFTSYASVIRFGDVVVFVNIVSPGGDVDHASFYDRIEAAAVSRAGVLL